MFGIYKQVVMVGLQNLIRSRVPILFNLNLAVWRDIATTPDQHRVVDFLTYSFSSGFEGEVLSPSFYNHTSTCNHPRDMANYITTDIGHGVLLGPVDYPPFFPWCQTSPLLTHLKKDSSNRWVILDLYWPLPPAPSVNEGKPRRKPRR